MHCCSVTNGKNGKEGKQSKGKIGEEKMTVDSYKFEFGDKIMRKNCEWKEGAVGYDWRGGGLLFLNFNLNYY